MIRKLLALTGAAAVASLGSLAIASPAMADDITTFTVTANPTEVNPGDTVTVTLAVTNNHDRKITYLPIAAPDTFAACAQDIGTLVPDETATVTCDGTVADGQDSYSFSIENSPQEHNETFAETTLTLTFIIEESPVVEEPTLPVTGSSMGWIALGGSSAVALGIVALRITRRRSQTH